MKMIATTTLILAVAAGIFGNASAQDEMMIAEGQVRVAPIHR